MAFEIKMPQLSDTMNAGKILKWYKSEGAAVQVGEVLAEVETEKANLEIEAFKSGVLLKIVTPAGASAKVGETIAFIGAAGEQVLESQAPIAIPPAGQNNSKIIANVAPAADSLPAKAPVQTEPAEQRVKASPLAKKIAAQQGVDLSELKGTGPQGRIVRRDVDGYSPKRDLPSQPAAPIAPAPSAAQPVGEVRTEAPGVGSFAPLSKMRAIIAERMQQSVVTAPHFYVTVSIEMSQAKQLVETLKRREEYKQLSITHLVVKAAGYALKREPGLNSALRDGQIYNPAEINIGLVTAVPDGLLIPVVRSVAALALGDLAFEVQAAVERARAGRPTSTDLTGGTFTISNMGMFGVDSFTAIINPGQGAVLAVGSIQKTPIVAEGQVQIGNVMKVTLSVDHRIIDGVMAGRFLGFLKEGLENPALLMP